jgi:drug/metabolite transporter (DMT)-like permease
VNQTKVYGLLILTAFLWGGNAIAVKKVLTEISPVVATVLRFAVFSSILICIAWCREGNKSIPERRHLPTLLLMGLSSTVLNNGLQFTGLVYSTAINCVVITAFGPAITGVLAAIVLDERLNKRQWTGVAISTAGVIVIASGGSWSRLVGLSLNWGDILFLLSCVGWSMYTIAGRRIMLQLSPMATTAWSGGFGTIMMLGIALLQGFDGSVPISGANWGWLAYMCFGSGLVAFTLWNVGVEAIGPNRASIFINLIPVSGILFSVLLLGETVGWFHGVGAAWIIGGVWLATRARRNAPDFSEKVV